MGQLVDYNELVKKKICEVVQMWAIALIALSVGVFFKEISRE